MKIGIDSYCYHRFFGEVYPEQEAPAEDERYDMARLLARATELGCDGLSLESCFLPSFDAGYLAELKAELDQRGFDRVYAWGHPDGLEAGTKPATKDEMIAHIPHAAAIGAEVMRVVGSSYCYWREPHEPQLQILEQWFKEATAIAEDHGIKLAVENHIDYDSDEILRLIDAVGSDHFGVNLDTANFLRVGDDPVEATEKLAPHVFATHIKDVEPVKGRHVREWNYLASTAAGEGLVEINKIAAILAKSGYPGFLAYEVDMPVTRWQGKEEAMIAQSIAWLKALRVEGAEPAAEVSHV